MDRQQIHAKIKELMAELFDLDPANLGLEARFQDLGLTSIDAIDLVVELQTMTGRKVNEAGLREVRTIGDMVALVEKHLRQESTAA
ncbi:MAG TPA: acyl carrier protein [Anaeromyxobacter sp.]|nr:acyl carrier protein [Anaeromyxobacter sp.]